MKPVNKLVLAILNLLTIGVCVVFATTCFAQEKFYNSLLQETNIYDYFQTEFVDVEELDVKHNIYLKNETRVVEFFDRENGEFLGVLIDPLKVKMASLDFVKENSRLKKLLKKNAPDLAMSIYLGRPVQGMTTEQVEDLLGSPDKFKYSFMQDQQVLKYVYEDMGTFYFVDGKYQSNIEATN